MKLAMNMVRRPFKAGDVIFEINEKCDELYLINSGTVDIQSREGLTLATLQPGELFVNCLARRLQSWASASEPPAPSPRRTPS